MSRMSSGNVSNQTLEEIFECSVCKTVTHSKILQCLNGHLACIICSSRMIKCPMCRIPLDPDMDKRTRALSAEQAIEAMDLNFSCRNHECTFSGQKKDLEKHEETCEYDERWEDVDDSDEDSSQYEDGSSDESDNSEYDNEDSEDSSSLSSLASITASEIEDLENGISDSELERLRQGIEAMRTNGCQ